MELPEELSRKLVPKKEVDANQEGHYLSSVMIKETFQAVIVVAVLILLGWLGGQP